jgi:hypothetical protein
MTSPVNIHGSAGVRLFHVCVCVWADKRATVYINKTKDWAVVSAVVAVVNSMLNIHFKNLKANYCNSSNGELCLFIAVFIGKGIGL